MAHIKLTLNKDDPIYARDIGKEADWMSQEGKLWYALHTRPKSAHPGCWVYFILDGQLRARAKAINFVETSKEEEYSYSGHKHQRKKWTVECSSPMEPAILPISHQGFQGFRYVTLDEEGAFEKAFVK
jgi:hypothetical protein